MHLIRNALAFVSDQDREAAAAALEARDRAKDAEAGGGAPEAFAGGARGVGYEALAPA